MNPTLSERLLTRRSDGFFRAHPAAPWDAVLETPVALQTLALVQPNVVAPPLPLAPPQPLDSGLTVSAAPLDSQAAQAPLVGGAPAELSPAPIPAAPDAAPTQDSGSAQELLVLVWMAVVWLVDGWLALRQGLRRRPTAAATTAAECKAGGMFGTPQLPSQPGMATAGSPPFAPRSHRPAPVLVA